eukprot:6484424-Amphidinium_carterae.1
MLTSSRSAIAAHFQPSSATAGISQGCCGCSRNLSCLLSYVASRSQKRALLHVLPARCSSGDQAGCHGALLT